MLEVQPPSAVLTAADADLHMMLGFALRYGGLQENDRLHGSPKTRRIYNQATDCWWLCGLLRSWRSCQSAPTRRAWQSRRHLQLVTAVCAAIFAAAVPGWHHPRASPVIVHQMRMV